MARAEQNDHPPPSSDGCSGTGPGEPGLSVTEHPTGARIVTVSGRLDAATAVGLRRLGRVLVARNVRRLVVDLTGSPEGPAADGVAALVDLAYESGDADIDLRIVSGAPASARTRTLAQQELFELYLTVEAALDGDG